MWISAVGSRRRKWRKGRAPRRAERRALCVLAGGRASRYRLRPKSAAEPSAVHDSAFEKAQVFRRAYLAPYQDEALTVLDVGSAVVAEGHRSNQQAFENPNWRYLGLDIQAAPNVEVVVADPYDWREVADASADVVACSQVLEHTEFFWITVLEIGRVLKPNGLAFIVAPGSGPLHRYPVDCWRFYDDGLPALARW